MTESNTQASGRTVMTFKPKMAIEHGATVRLSLVRDHRNVPRWAELFVYFCTIIITSKIWTEMIVLANILDGED